MSESFLMVDGQAGKGDKPRPVDKKKFDETIDRLYGEYCRFPHVHGPDCKLKPKGEEK